MNTTKRLSLVLLCSIALAGSMSAVTNNLFLSYDPVFHRLGSREAGWDLSVVSELGYDASGRQPVDSEDDDLGSTKVNPLQLWTKDQNMLAMLKGAEADTAAYVLAQTLNIDDDDGFRGHVIPTGDFKISHVTTLAARWNIKWNVALSLFVPFYSMKLSNLAFEDQTSSTGTSEDALVRSTLTNDIPGNIEALTGIKAQNWSRQGLGDMVANASWSHHFEQHRPLLKGVELAAHAGLSFPTSKNKNEDRFFDVPFGYDGAYAIPFGGSLGLDITKYLCFKINADFVHRLGTTRAARRLRVDESQTDLLLLRKTSVYVDWGFIQRFTLSFQTRNLAAGLRARALYQYQHIGEDEYFVNDSTFSAATANGAASMDESSTHHV
ncbi:hypothetical protein HOK96_01395, partial [bacterium]|nr:hypothetical protein [bacterium]